MAASKDRKSSQKPRGPGALLETFDKPDRCSIKAGPDSRKVVPAVGRTERHPERPETGFGWDWFDQLPRLKAAIGAPVAGQDADKAEPARPSVSTDTAGGGRKILEAAVSEFAARGFHGGRMGGIARKADCNKALIHYYFKGKANLYHSVLAETAEQIVAHLEKGLARLLPEDDCMASLMTCLLELELELKERLVIVQRELLEGGAELRQAVGRPDERTGNLAAKLESLGPGWRPERLLTTVGGLLAAVRLAVPPGLDDEKRSRGRAVLSCLLNPKN